MSDDINLDDGMGPYTFCERGRSRCLDQTCGCVDNVYYRSRYLRARREMGWPILAPSGRYALLYLAACALVGALAGAGLTMTIVEIIRAWRTS